MTKMEGMLQEMHWRNAELFERMNRLHLARMRQIDASLERSERARIENAARLEQLQHA